MINHWKAESIFYIGSNLCFHVKSKVKSKNNILKSYDHAESVSHTWKQIWQTIFSCKILGEKKKIKIKCSTSLKRSGHVESMIGYYKIKCDTSLKSYDHAELKSGAWKQIWQLILPCKILG